MFFFFFNMPIKTLSSICKIYFKTFFYSLLDIEWFITWFKDLKIIRLREKKMEISYIKSDL
jgi:hypothetical protein